MVLKKTEPPKKLPKGKGKRKNVETTGSNPDEDKVVIPSTIDIVDTDFLYMWEEAEPEYPHRLETDFNPRDVDSLFDTIQRVEKPLIYSRSVVFAKTACQKNLGNWIYRNFKPYYNQRGLQHVLFTGTLRQEECDFNESWELIQQKEAQLIKLLKEQEIIQIQFVVSGIEYTPGGEEKVKLSQSNKKQSNGNIPHPRFVYNVGDDPNDIKEEVIRVFSHHEFDVNSQKLTPSVAKNYASVYTRIVKYAMLRGGPVPRIDHFREMFHNVLKYRNVDHTQPELYEDFVNFIDAHGVKIFRFVYDDLSTFGFITHKKPYSSRRGYPHVHMGIYYTSQEHSPDDVHEYLTRLCHDNHIFTDTDSQSKGPDPGQSGSSAMSYTIKESTFYKSFSFLGRNPTTLYNFLEDTTINILLGKALQQNRMEGMIDGVLYPPEGVESSTVFTREQSIKNSASTSFGDMANPITVETKCPPVAILYNRNQPLGTEFAHFIDAFRGFMDKKCIKLVYDKRKFGPYMPNVVQKVSNTKMTFREYPGGDFNGLWSDFLQTRYVSEILQIQKFRKHVEQILTDGHATLLPMVHMDYSWVELQDCYFNTSTGVVSKTNTYHPCYAHDHDITYDTLLELESGSVRPPGVLHILENSGYVDKYGEPTPDGRRLIKVMLQMYLTPSSKSVVPFLHGPSNCGKTAFSRIVTRIFPAYARGFSSRSATFALENLIAKIVSLHDEFDPEGSIHRILEMLETNTEILIDLKGISNKGKKATSMYFFPILASNTYKFLLNDDAKRLVEAGASLPVRQTTMYGQQVQTEPPVTINYNNILYTPSNITGGQPPRVNTQMMHTGAQTRIEVFPFRTLKSIPSGDIYQIYETETVKFAIWAWHHSPPHRDIISETDLGIVPLSGIIEDINLPFENKEDFYQKNRKWLFW